jgi:hypothetical protein
MIKLLAKETETAGSEGVSECVSEGVREMEVDIDFAEEVSGLASALVLARRVGGEWANVDVAGRRDSLDQQALSITESKEEVSE